MCRRRSLIILCITSLLAPFVDTRVLYGNPGRLKTVLFVKY